MEILALFFVELFVLFLFSRMLQRGLSLFIFQITKSMKWTISILAFIFLPGTFIHELAHFLMAYLLFVPVGKMEFLPKQEGESVKLGSVSIGRCDPFRRLFIGVAPFLAGTTLIILTLFVAEKESLWGMNYAVVIILYILFEVGNSMFSSKKDLEGAIAVIVLVLLTIILLYFFGIKINFTDLQKVLTNQTIHVFYQGTIYLLFPLGLDLGLITLLSISNKLLSR
jgi:hypothetical protein